MFKTLVIVVLLCVQHIKTGSKEGDLEKRSPVEGNSEESNSKRGNPEQGNFKRNNFEEDNPKEYNSEKSSSEKDSYKEESFEKDDSEEDDSEGDSSEEKSLDYYTQGNKGTYIGYANDFLKYLKNKNIEGLGKLESMDKNLPCLEKQTKKIEDKFKEIESTINHDVENHKMNLEHTILTYGFFDISVLSKQIDELDKLRKDLFNITQCAAEILEAKCAPHILCH